MAQEHNCVDTYAEYIGECGATHYPRAYLYSIVRDIPIATGDEATTEQYEALAEYFETRRKPHLTGRFYYKAKQHGKVGTSWALCARLCDSACAWHNDAYEE